MNRKLIQLKSRTLNWAALSCLSLFLLACGGGASSVILAGIGGTGIVFGEITAFGSVYVNGTRFETDESQFIVDGNSATQDDLKVGMLVQLQVETEDGVYTGNATTVTYDDSVQGPVDATPVVITGSGGNKKTFLVFGHTVTIDKTGTVFDMTGFDDLDAMDVVEVSGFYTAPDAIEATYVRKVGDLNPGVSEVELRGHIAGLDTGLMQFTINGVVINYVPGTEIEVNGPLIDGMLVEVEGVIQADSSVLADEIEEEAGLGNEVDDVSIQGIISSYSSNADFVVNNLPVDASQADFSPATLINNLANGVEVEIEGDIVGGVLVANEVEFRDGDSGVSAYVDAGSINPGNSSFSVSFASLGSVLIRVDAQTAFNDEAGASPIQNMTFNDLAAGDYLRVEGAEQGNEIIASSIKRTDAEDSLELEGAVDSYIPGVSITVLGIQYILDGSTSYEPQPPNIAVGDIVEIEDDDELANPADGIADEVEEEI